MRQVSEPGGRLLVGLGAPGGALANAIGRHRDDVSLTVLISPGQQDEATGADEIWVFTRLGPIGFLALIRRISWRRFERVDQFRTGAFRMAEILCLAAPAMVLPARQWRGSEPTGLNLPLTSPNTRINLGIRTRKVPR